MSENTEKKAVNKTAASDGKLRSITIDEIHAISLEDMLRYLNIQYVVKGDLIKLCEWDQITDGWIGSRSKNIVTDFSNKWRPAWSLYSFVKDLLDLDDKWTFEFFKNYKYGIGNFERVLIESSYKKIEHEEDLKKRAKSLKTMVAIYNKMEWNDEELKKYLAGRKIDYDKLPENIRQQLKAASIHFEGIRYNDKIFIPMKDLEKDDEGNLSVKTVWIKARSISPEANSKFKSISIKNSYIGMFFSDDILKVKEWKLMFLCEGETDAMALYSAGFKNVFWNLGWVWYVNKNFNDLFKRFKRIVIAYDNDEPGRNWIKKVVETVGFEATYFVLNFEKVRDNLSKLNPEALANWKLDWKLDINDILKFVDWDTEKFKDVIQKSSQLFDKDALLKEIKQKEAEMNKAFKKAPSPIKKQP